jgi:hypothetical protein
MVKRPKKSGQLEQAFYDNLNTTCRVLLGCGGSGDAAFCRNIGI